jgi:hypothetical protein
MNDKVEFFPFHAINEFMLNDYRLNVIQMVLSSFDDLSSDRRKEINSIIKKHVQVPGFRTSTQAPPKVKAKASVSTFERRPDYVAQILQGWADLHRPLADKVYEFLTSREWEVFPVEMDRTELPGFMVTWPAGETYDVLGDAFAEANPGYPVEENDLRLMIVWLANRLPFNTDGDEDEEFEDEEDED